MSLYFEGYVAFDLSPNTPQDVIEILSYLCRGEDYDFDVIQDHEFFDGDYWRNFLKIENHSCGLPGMTWREFDKVIRFQKSGEDHYRHTLSFRRTMHDDVEFYHLWWHFLYWISPYIETRGFVGFYRDTYSVHPTPIYALDGKIFRSEISSTPVGWYDEEWKAGTDSILPRLSE